MIESFHNFQADSRNLSLVLKPVDVNSLLKMHKNFLKRNLGRDFRMEMKLATQLPSVNTDIVMFEQILFVLTKYLNKIISADSSLIYETAISYVDHLFEHISNTDNSGMFVMLTITEKDFEEKHDRSEHLPIHLSTAVKEHKGLVHSISTAHSTLYQQGGFMTWRLDHNQRHKIEIFLPTNEN